MPATTLYRLGEALDYWAAKSVSELNVEATQARL